MPALEDISDIQIDLDMTHTWMGDLIVTLIAPNANSHVIFHRTGSTSGNGAGYASELNGVYMFSDILPTSANWWVVAIPAGETIPTGVYRTTTAGGDPLGNGVDTVITSAFNSTMPAGNWVLNVSDNAGSDTGSINAATLKITAGPPDQLTSSFSAFNSNFGFFFDITAKTEDITVRRFDINRSSGTGVVTAYSKMGSYTGFETNAAAWTNRGSKTLTSIFNTPTPYDIQDVEIPAGQTAGFYFHSTNNPLRYFTVSESHENSDIIISDGKGQDVGGAPFSGSLYSPRGFSGTVYYGDEESCYIVKAANNSVVTFCL